MIGLATGREDYDATGVPSTKVGVNLTSTSAQPTDQTVSTTDNDPTTLKQPQQQQQQGTHELVDMNGDIKLLEEAALQGRRLGTGPCHTGTRRMGHGPPSITSKVILVTASGNYMVRNTLYIT